MSNSTIQVQIATAHWLKRKVIYIPKKWAGFFPIDALGARGEKERLLYPKNGKTVIFDYGVAQSECDIATDKDGKMRMRESGAVGRFYELNSAAVGDYVTITKVDSRRFEIRLVKTDGTAI